MSVVALAGAAVVAAASGVSHGATANASGPARSVATGGYAWPAPTPITELVSGDLNNDRRADLALVGGPEWSAVPTAFSNGNGSFTIRHKSAPDFAWLAEHPEAKAVTTDLNGDSYYHTVAPSPYFAQLASQPKAKLIAGQDGRVSSCGMIASK